MRVAGRMPRVIQLLMMERESLVSWPASVTERSSPCASVSLLSSRGDLMQTRYSRPMMPRHQHMERFFPLARRGALTPLFCSDGQCTFTQRQVMSCGILAELFG